METENYPNTAPLHFLPYITWDQRGEAPKSPGIYVISKATPENLIYVGLTQQTDGLRGRLRQFHRSATTGMHNHAGGVTYHRLFGAEVSDLIFTIRRVEDIIAPSRALREALTELIAHTNSIRVILLSWPEALYHFWGQSPPASRPPPLGTAL